MGSVESTLDKIRISLTRLTKITPFRRLLQRHEISDSIAESHRSLDACIEIFDVSRLPGLRLFVLNPLNADRNFSNESYKLPQPLPSSQLTTKPLVSEIRYNSAKL